MSQTVKALEEELGTALVSRGKGGVMLTADSTLMTGVLILAAVLAPMAYGKSKAGRLN